MLMTRGPVSFGFRSSLLPHGSLVRFESLTTARECPNRTLAGFLCLPDTASGRARLQMRGASPQAKKESAALLQTSSANGSTSILARGAIQEYISQSIGENSTS